MNRMMMMLAIAAMALTGVAHGHDFKVGQMSIDHPWTRATPKGAKVAGGYMTIVNMGDAADRLIGGSIEVAGRFEIHRMSMEGGVMRMRQIEGGLEIKPNASVELKPGSIHLMFVDLKRPLEEGQRLKGALMFEKAGKVEIEFVVEAIGAGPAPHSKH